MHQLPVVTKMGGLFSSVSGVFFRAVDPAHRDAVLSGSRLAGRYSRASEPALYLSSSREGVRAALIAHADSRTQSLEIVELAVDVARIVDFRDPAVVRAAGIDLADAMAPWQEVVRRGETPRSWKVRDQLQALGAAGLIDPSRHSPGLWHLTLFQWNHKGTPTVEIL